MPTTQVSCRAAFGSSLTLPRLKPGGSGSTPATSGPCQGRYSDRSEILDGVGLDLAVATVRRFRADVVRPVHVPMHPRAAACTPKPASARRGGLDVPTHTTRSGGIRFVDPLHADPQPRRLLVEVADDLPMRPLADLLVGDPAQAQTGLDVAHIPHRNVRDALDLAECDDLP